MTVVWGSGVGTSADVFAVVGTAVVWAWLVYLLVRDVLPSIRRRRRR